MKRTFLYTLLISLLLPVSLLAQYGGGISNGETFNAVHTLQLDGSVVNLYLGGNGRGEFITATSSNTLNGDTANLYGGGIGRGETIFATVANALNGDTVNLYGGGIGRGETIFATVANALNGDTVSLYGGGIGRGENVLVINTNQLDGNLPFLYGGGNGRGEVTAALNTNQLDGVGVAMYGGGNGRGETVLQVSTSALPITLLNFDATAEGDKVKVQWQTTSESSSSYYLVERSSDGIHWQSVGTLPAAGISSSLLSYQLYDNVPLPGVSYYRLKAVDSDGHFTYSGIAKVKFINGTSYTVSVYPNPAAYQFTLSLKGLQAADKYSIRVLSAMGQVVYLKTDLSGNIQTIDISKLAAGTYYVVVDTKEQSITVKVVKS